MNGHCKNIKYSFSVKNVQIRKNYNKMGKNTTGNKLRKTATEGIYTVTHNLTDNSVVVVVKNASKRAFGNPFGKTFASPKAAKDNYKNILLKKLISKVCQIPKFYKL